MEPVKKIIKKYWKYFFYFYSYLGYRIFVSLVLSLLVGVMDGFGLAMFIPLLQTVDAGNSAPDGSNLGNMSFLVKAFDYFGVSLNLVVVLAVILVFFTIKGALKFAEGYYRVVNEQLFMKKIRSRNIHGLASFSYNLFVNTDTGRIQNTFSAEVEKVKQGYRYYFTAFQYGIFVIVYVFMAFFANPQFAVLVVIGGLLSNLVFMRLHKTTKTLSKKVTTDSHDYQGLLIQTVSFFKYLKATGLVHKYADKLIRTNDKIMDSNRRAGLISATLTAVREPLTILVVVLVIIIQVKYFSQNVGAIILSLLLFYRGLVSLMGTQNYWNLFLGVSGSLSNMTQFIQELRSGREKTGSKMFTVFNDAIRLEQVSFDYDGNSILNNIDLTIPKNRTIAIVGESGSGKTTLINLLAALLKPGSGRLLVDGVDMRELNTESYQKRLGYITQEPVIFSDTIFNNVTFWDEPTEANRQRFLDALKKASIYDFVMEQPLKENAVLGSSGVNISGGQKQRLSIARELYKEVDILFMDEATSALDSETERSIQENIESLKGSYTIIIIAHRLSTIRDADSIILLNKGRIDDVGNFEELQSRSAFFRKMVELQGF